MLSIIQRRVPLARHRGRGEGSLAARSTLHKDGSKKTAYTALLPLNAEGKRPSVGTFSTKTEAKEALARAMTAMSQGKTVATKTPTFREWWTDHVESRTGLAHRTRVDYRHTALTVFPYIGDIRLDKLTEEHIGRMWRLLALGEDPTGRERRPLAATTLATKYAHVNAVLRAAVKSRHVALMHNPAEDAKPERGERREINPLTQEEMAALLQATRDDDEYAIWLVLLLTGCRPSECRALRWTDVSFDLQQVSIQKSLHRETGKGHVLGPTKTRKSRVVHLRPTLVKALREETERNQSARAAAGEMWREHGFVFTRPDGLPVDENGLRRKFDLACAKAGVKRRTLKETRHTFATLAISHGVPVKVVSETLGHASVQITLDIYAHVLPSMQRDAYQYLDGIAG
jgi:integrase